MNTEEFRSLPLPERMRLAADVLREANARINYESDDPWNCCDLEAHADIFDTEDRTKAELAEYTRWPEPPKIKTFREMIADAKGAADK